MTTSINPCGVPLLNVGRDVHGRFTKANPGGPGNPFARKVAALRKALLDSVSEQDLKDVVEILKLKVRQGDLAAVKLLLQYCVGQPESPKDPDRMDADEWQRLQEMRVSEKQFWKTVEDFPACLACHEATISWPCEAQDGPLAEAVHYVHSQLLADGQPSTAPTRPGKNTTPDGARPDPAPVNEPSVPTAERPSSPKGEGKASDRHEPAAGSRRDGRSLTRPPSPNGGIGEEQRQPSEQPRHHRQPSRPSGQAERKPPRG